MHEKIYKYLLYLTLTIWYSNIYTQIRVIENEQEYRHLMQSNQPKVLLFYSSHCALCKHAKEALMNISKSDIFKDIIIIAFIDYDQLKDISDKAIITLLPTIIFTYNDYQERIEGIQDIQTLQEQFTQKIEMLLQRQRQQLSYLHRLRFRYTQLAERGCALFNYCQERIIYYAKSAHTCVQNWLQNNWIIFT